METERRARWESGVEWSRGGDMPEILLVYNEQTQERKKKTREEKRKKNRKANVPFSLVSVLGLGFGFLFGHSRNISGKRINLELKKKNHSRVPQGKVCIYLSIICTHVYVVWLGGRKFWGFGGRFWSCLILSFFSFLFFLEGGICYLVSRLLLLVLLSYYLGFSKLKAIPIPI